jgi:hypothetical protein
MRLSLSIATALAGACLAFNVSAQSTQSDAICKRAAPDKQAACVDFVKNNRWDEGKGMYVNKKTGKPSSEAGVGVPTKAEIRAEKEKFLANNKWDDGKGMWVPLDKSRPVCEDKECNKTRADVKADAAAFNKTHKWDDGKSMYVLITPTKK